jgi:hypothetical protein
MRVIDHYSLAVDLPERMTAPRDFLRSDFQLTDFSAATFCLTVYSLLLPFGA